MGSIRTIELDGEKIHLRKSTLFKMGWNVVHPVKNDDGSINWFNALCGNYKGLVNLIVIALIVSAAFLGFHEVTVQCKDMAAHPADYFSCCQGCGDTMLSFDGKAFPTGFNITEPER